MGVATRRLPGFRFEVQPPPLREVLPRMDIAVLVGFASSGPLHLPVAMEDVAQFTAVFGDDAPLAWDTKRGEQVYAYLAPAVRAFFRNGGRRCWVIRVADQNQAQTNLFPIPGLAQVIEDNGNITDITPAFALARSPGSWSDAWRTSAVLLSQSLPVLAVTPTSIQVEPTVASTLRPGDLLRLTYHTEGYILMCLVKGIEAVLASPPDSNPIFQVTGSQLWLQTVILTSPPQAVTAIHLYTHSSQGEVVPAIGPPEVTTNGIVTLTLQLSLAAAPAPGTLLRADVDKAQWWLLVQNVQGGEDEGSPPQATIQVSGPAVEWLTRPPESWPSGMPVVEQLSFDLWARHSQNGTRQMSNLAFGLPHPRFWGGLPDDQKLFSLEETDVPDPLWQQAVSPRFPLAGNDVTGFTFPLFMPILPESYQPPLRTTTTSLERDGLATFQAGLFLDTSLAGTTTADLMTKADFIRYQSTQPRSLTGIHAALAVSQATLIAVPDAVHLGWSLGEPPSALLPESVLPLERPEWWHFRTCAPTTQIDRRSQPEWGNFLDCAIEVIESPVLYHDTLDTSGTFTLFWQADAATEKAHYILEEATRSNFSDAKTIYEGAESRLVIYGRSPGHYYYHVRLQIGSNSSDWSNGEVVQVAPVSHWQINEPAAQAEETLAIIHRALLRLCAARGDIFAILSLPAHYREKETIAYTAVLQPSAPPMLPGNGTLFTLPLGFGEIKTLSYGALYHPWLIGSEENRPNQLQHMPPDGALCGLTARRTLARGAWVAPANELLHGVVALTPPMAQEQWLSLQEAQINLIRQEPYGFVPLSADTLSIEAELRPINVRRLLILLRRLANRQGANYVFEPYDEVFRRMVQRSFEAILDYLFVRGAFAGKTAATSFQVITRSTSQDRDQGRFIVELRVAPSHPLTFLTIRLVQNGDRGLVTEEMV